MKQISRPSGRTSTYLPRKTIRRAGGTNQGLARKTNQRSAEWTRAPRAIGIGKSRCDERKYGIRFSLGYVVWPLEVAKHLMTTCLWFFFVYVYRPISLKIAHNTWHHSFSLHWPRGVKGEGQGHKNWYHSQQWRLTDHTDTYWTTIRVSDFLRLRLTTDIRSKSYTWRGIARGRIRFHPNLGIGSNAC